MTFTQSGGLPMQLKVLLASYRPLVKAIWEERATTPAAAGVVDNCRMQEKVMKKEVGLWIDHREAVIITVADEGEAIQRIRSDMEQHSRFSARAPEGAPEDRRDRRFGEHLHRYYDAVIAAIRDADAILIVGPGEAKGELAQQLEHAKLRGRIVGIETVDKLTEAQLVAKIRQHFRVPAKGGGISPAPSPQNRT